MPQTSSASGSSESQPVTTAQGRYELLQSTRDPYLRRGRDAAELTIPALLPQDGANGSTDYARPWQSVGARGVNNLSAKLLLTLFPPGASFFRLAVDESVINELKAQAGDGEDVEGEVQKALSGIERVSTSYLESTNLRAVMAEVLNHLVVVGNALLYQDSKGFFKWFRLNKYVVVRDLSGNPLEIIVKESLSYQTLPQKARDALMRSPQQNRANGSEDAPVDLFTRAVRDGDGGWSDYQEIAGVEVEGSRGVYPKDKSPWMPLAWKLSEGEHYARSHVDDLLGDLVSLESLSQSIVDGAAAMARFINFVDEAGVTSRQKFAEAPNLAVLDGNARDITTWSASQKTVDLSVAQQQVRDIQQRLEQGFLLSSSIQRNAERVTAEEIRLMANELEQTLGVVYPGLAKNLQLPIVARTLLLLRRQKKIPEYPDKSVNPQIITGIDGLGRTSEFSRMDLLMNNVAQKFGPQAVAEYVNVGAYITRAAAALAVSTEGWINSEEQVQSNRQAQQQAALAQSLGPEAIKANASRDVAAQRAEATAQTAAAQSQVAAP